MNSKIDFTISSENKEIISSIDPVSCEGEVEVFRLKLRFAEKVDPKKVFIDWEENMVNMVSVWTGQMCSDTTIHQNWWPTKASSSFCFGAPLLSVLGEDGMNSTTVAVADAKTPVDIKFWVRNVIGDYKVKFSIVFFDGICDPIEEYETYIRIDKRKIPYYESIQSVYPWWKEMGWEIPPIPSAAEDPLYSSWYNFLQIPKQDALLDDLRIASELGFRTVILDDGWQTEGVENLNYSICGEWVVSKDRFYDFASFVKEVHKLGMKLMVWFAVPFIGHNSPLHEKFKGRYLSNWGKTSILDPRYPEVREYIKGTYKRILREYDIDGFKLDYIDQFHSGSLTAEYGGDMDTVTIGAAAERLLQEIVAELNEIKPNLLFEYRQNYIGPAINRFGNMLRVGDCAYDANINRRELVKLRLLGYPVAVHSDMLFWSPEESITLCARQLLNIMFSVPQISVLLVKSTSEQKDLVRNFLSYWTANRETILHGKFRPLHPEFDYTEVSAEGEDKIISVLYDDLPYTYDGKDTDVFCAGERGGLIFENPTDAMLSVEIFDCLGNLTQSVACGARSIIRLNVPKMGLAKIRA